MDGFIERGGNPRDMFAVFANFVDSEDESMAAMLLTALEATMPR